MTENKDSSSQADAIFEILKQNKLPSSSELRNKQEPKHPLKESLLDYTKLLELPDPEPLVQGLLDKDTLARLYGEPGGCKSFIALDLSAHISLGKPWKGYKVEKGPVLYVASEGSSRFKKRLQAWVQHYEQEPSELHIMPRAIQVTDRGSWDELVELAVELKVSLVVLDTQARMTVSLNENSDDMSTWVRAQEQLREATKCCVLSIHHPPKGGGSGRGWSGVYGALDTELVVKRLNQDVIQIVNEKYKDNESGRKVNLSPVQVDLGYKDSFGDSVTSLVITEPQKVTASDEGTVQEKIVAVMSEVFPEGGTQSEIRAVCVERGICKASSKSTFYKPFQQLQKKNEIYSKGSKYFVVRAVAQGIWGDLHYTS